MMAWSLSVSVLQSMHFLVSGLVNLMTGNSKHTFPGLSYYSPILSVFSLSPLTVFSLTS